MKHIDKNKLELYFLMGEQSLSKGEISEIELHLNECKYCADSLNKLKLFYSIIESEASQPASEADEIIASRILQKKSLLKSIKLLPQRKEVILRNESTEISLKQKYSIIKPIINLIRKHPYRSGSLAIASLIFFSLIFTKFNSELPFPTYAEIKNRVLYVYSKEAELIWEKAVPGISDFNSDLPLYENLKRHLLLEDIDDDYINEILITGNEENNLTPADTLFCYDYKGSLKWKAGCGDFREFDAPMWKHTAWVIKDFFTVKNSDSNTKLFAIVNDKLFAPAKLVEIDPANGSITKEFYNSGGIATHLVNDVDADGRKEILIGGINNALESAFVAVLDPERINGFSPSSSNYIPIEYQKGDELVYISIPRSNLGKLLSNTIYNSIRQIEKKQNGFIVYTKETLDAPYELDSGLLYEFDSKFNIVDISAAVTFQNNYQKLLSENKLHEPLDSDYFRKLKEGVMYWNGERFVNYRATNKNYSFKDGFLNKKIP